MNGKSLGSLTITPDHGSFPVGQSLTVNISISGANATWLYYVIWTESNRIIAQKDADLEPGKDYTFTETFEMPNEKVYVWADAGNGESLNARATYYPLSPSPSPFEQPRPSPSTSPSPQIGTVVLTYTSHPTNVIANIEVNWYALAQVRDSNVPYPFVGYFYKDGSADSITIVYKDGTTTPLPKGALAVYQIDNPSATPGTTIDSRNEFKGTIFPIQGIYYIYIYAGYYYNGKYYVTDTAYYYVTASPPPSPGPSPSVSPSPSPSEQPSPQPSPSPSVSPSPSASPSQGKVVITDYNHPDSVNVGSEFKWYVVGQVKNGYVNQPAIAYVYWSGPADKIEIVDKNGYQEDLPVGYGIVNYMDGTQPEGTTVDSRDMKYPFRGAIYPAPGTYDIRLWTGQWTGSDFIVHDQKQLYVSAQGGPSPSPSSSPSPSPSPPPSPAPQIPTWLIVALLSAVGGITAGIVLSKR